MYRLRKQLDADQHYILILASIEFPELGMSTLDERLIVREELGLNATRFANEVLARSQQTETMQGSQDLKAGIWNEIMSLVEDRPGEQDAVYFWFKIRERRKICHSCSAAANTLLASLTNEWPMLLTEISTKPAAIKRHLNESMMGCCCSEIRFTSMQQQVCSILKTR